MKFSFVIALLTLFFIGQSCSILFMPKLQDLQFETASDSTSIVVMGKEIGSGENFVGTIERRGYQVLEVQTPGFEDDCILITPEKRNPVFYPLVTLDVFLLPFGMKNRLLYNPVSLNYASLQIIPKQTPKHHRDSTERYLQVKKISIEIKDANQDIQFYSIRHNDTIESTMLNEIQLRKTNEKEALEKEALSMQELSKKQRRIVTSAQAVPKDTTTNPIFAEDTKFTEDLFNELLETGYVDTINKIFQDVNNTLILQTRIEKVDEFNIFDLTSSYRRLGVTMTWFSMNVYDEIIDSTSVYAFSDPFVGGFMGIYSGEDYAKMMGTAVKNAFTQLRKESSYIEKMKVQYDFSSKEPMLTLQKPQKWVSDLADATSATVIVKHQDGSHGSGFAITQDGYILTNYHVISGKYQGKSVALQVILSDGQKVDAQVVRYNTERDIALLKISHPFETPFQLLSEKKYKPIMEVYALGAPKSIELGQSISAGLLSNDRNTNNNRLLQLNMSLNGGNSGGPVFDKAGQLHGVVQSKLVGKDTEGVAFAIPSYLISDYLKIQLK